MRGLSNSSVVIGIDLSVVSRRLNGIGNITLKTISDTYTAMNREPLSNFVPPRAPIEENNEQAQTTEPNLNKRLPQDPEIVALARREEMRFSLKPFVETSDIKSSETLHSNNPDFWQFGPRAA